MARPSKRLKLLGEDEEMSLRNEDDLGGLHRRQADVTVAVTATLQVSVAVDDDGDPIATTTVLPSITSPQSLSASATSTRTSTRTGSDSQASAAAPSTPVSSTNSAASTSGPSPTPFPSFSPLGNSTVSPTGSSTIGGLLTAPSGTNSFSSSLFPFSSSSPFLSSPIVPLSPTGAGVPGGAGVGGGGADATSFPTTHRGNATAKAPGDNSTSPPVVAGAVVGSVGGTAVVLLVIVLLARYWKQHSRDSRDYSQGGESAQELHTSPAPIMSHHPARQSFLPAAAASWIHRLSGGHNRSSSPTLPDVQQERGFQKLSGRKLPSQFPTGAEEGPVARDFGDPDAIHPMARRTGISDSSSYYRDSRDTTQFFGSGRGSQVMRDNPNIDRDARDTAQFFNGPPRIARKTSPRDAAPAYETPHSIPPLFSNARSTTPSPQDAAPPEQPNIAPGTGGTETLMPSPARTPVVHTGGLHNNTRGGASPNAPWAPNPNARSPEPYNDPHISWPDSGYRRPERR